MRPNPGEAVRNQGPGPSQSVWTLSHRRGPQEGGLARARQDPGALSSQG